MRSLFRKIKAFFYRKHVIRCCFKVGQGLKVNGRCDIHGKVILGNNVNFNGISIRGSGEVVIGNNFHSGVNCVFLTSNHNYEGDKIPYDEQMVNKRIEIGDNVWIGDNVLIIGNCKIEEGAIVQAGSVVSSSHIERCSIVGGNPARTFKYRDSQKYERLKEQGRIL